MLIPAQVLREFKKVEGSDDVLVLEGLTILSPRGTRPYWRVKFHWKGRAYEKSGGRTYESAWAVIEIMRKQLLSLKLSHDGKPEKSFRSVAQMLEDYFDNMGPDGDWSARTLADRGSDFKELKNIGKGVPCDSLTKNHLRQFIATASTQPRAKHLKGVLGTFLRWGAATGYLSDQQAQIAPTLKWERPKGYSAIPNRRNQAKMHDPLSSGAPGGNVPSHSQVTQWATKCGDRYIHGEGMIHTDANIGLRSAELRILTADVAVALQGLGNLVRPETAEVHVRFQDNGGSRKLPKSSKQRDVVIPSVQMIATNFDVRAFLAKRCKEALAEQTNGSNPLALIFPNSEGGVWNTSGLRKHVWAPAARELGWQMKSYERADGETRSMLRFTLHSLRDRFATTAVSEWRYAENQLLEQGSWEDSETVRRFYAGITDDTHGDVRKMHGLG